MGWNHLSTVWGSLFFEKAIKFLHWYFLFNGKKLLSFTVPKKKKTPLTHLWGHELALTSSTEFKFPGICLWQKNLRFILHSQLLKLNLCLAGQFVSRSLYNSVIPVWFHGTMYKNKLMHVARLPCQNTIPVPAVTDSAGAAAMLKKCWSVTAICRTLSDTIPFLTLNVQITGHFKCSAAPATT